MWETIQDGAIWWQHLAWYPTGTKVTYVISEIHALECVCFNEDAIQKKQAERAEEQSGGDNAEDDGNENTELNEEPDTGDADDARNEDSSGDVNTIQNVVSCDTMCVITCQLQCSPCKTASFTGYCLGLMERDFVIGPS